jgi:hypothetical protein
MACKSCGSENQTEFASEISVHISGLKNVDKPTVMVFPRLLVCMDCGFAELEGFHRVITFLACMVRRASAKNRADENSLRKCIRPLSGE